MKYPRYEWIWKLVWARCDSLHEALLNPTKAMEFYGTVDPEQLVIQFQIQLNDVLVDIRKSKKAKEHFMKGRG